MNAQNILKSCTTFDCWKQRFRYFNILFIILFIIFLLCKLSVLLMKVKILQFKYFIIDVIISSLLYLMNTWQFYDFIEAADARRNSCKLATKAFVLLKNLKHSERNNEDGDVAKNRYIAKSIKKTSFAFFKNLIVIVSHSFKKQFQFIYHDFEIICEVNKIFKSFKSSFINWKL